MSTGSSRRRDQVRTDGPPPTLTWRCWPAREHAVGTLIVLAGLAAAGAGVRLLTGQTHLALFAVGVLGLALWRFFLPVAFELNPEGVDQWLLGRHRRVHWTAVRRYEVCSAGVLLLPFADRSAMDAFRGLYLPWGDHREAVLFQVRYYLDRPH